MNAWEHGARWTVGPEGVRQFEIGRRAFEDAREEREIDTAFLAVVKRADKALSQAAR